MLRRGPRPRPAVGQLFQAGCVEDRFGVGQPDRIILLEARENTPQGGGPVGCADHEGMDSDDHRRCRSRGIGAGLTGELQHVVQPESLDLPGVFIRASWWPMSTVTTG